MNHAIAAVVGPNAEFGESFPVKALRIPPPGHPPAKKIEYCFNYKKKNNFCLFCFQREQTCVSQLQRESCVRTEVEIAGLVFVVARILLLCFGLSRRWEEKCLQAESNVISNSGLLLIVLCNVAIFKHLNSRVYNL